MRFASLVPLFASMLVVFGSACNVVGQSGSLSSRDQESGDANSDWPTFLGPRGDSKSTERGIRKDWSGEGLPILWDRQLHESYGTCTVSNGRVYQFDGVRAKGSMLGQLWCLESKTGEALWKYQYNYQYQDQYGYSNGPRTSPIVDGDRVYLYGVDGQLICVDGGSGKQLWRRDANREFGVVQNFFGVGSNPVVFDDLLIVMVGGSPAGGFRIDQATVNGSGIVAFDKHTGEVRYRLSDQLASYASLKLVQYEGRPWCFALMRGGLLTFDPRNGKQDFFYPWRARALESVNASVPVVFGDHVFISETYGPGSSLLNFAGGKPLVVWKDSERRRSKSMQTHWNTAIFHEGYLYGSSGRHASNAELRCIEATTGKVMWSKPGLTRASLLYVDGHFICLGEDGMLRLVEATPTAYRVITSSMLQRNGEPLLGTPAWAAPVLAHGLLYVRGADRLVCAELIPE